jgi:hypothetical protein
VARCHARVDDADDHVGAQRAAPGVEDVDVGVRQAAEEACVLESPLIGEAGVVGGRGHRGAQHVALGPGDVGVGVQLGDRLVGGAVGDLEALDARADRADELAVDRLAGRAPVLRVGRRGEADDDAVLDPGRCGSRRGHRQGDARQGKGERPEEHTHPLDRPAAANERGARDLDGPSRRVRPDRPGAQLLVRVHDQRRVGPRTADRGSACVGLEAPRLGPDRCEDLAGQPGPVRGRSGVASTRTTTSSPSISSSRIRGSPRVGV